MRVKIVGRWSSEGRDAEDTCKYHKSLGMRSAYGRRERSQNALS